MGFTLLFTLYTHSHIESLIILEEFIQAVFFLTFFVTAHWDVGSEEQSEVDNEALGQHSSKHTGAQHT